MGYMVDPIPNQIPRDQRDTVSGGLYGYDLASYAETERRKGGREALGTSHSILGIPALWGKKKHVLHIYSPKFHQVYTAS